MPLAAPPSARSTIAGSRMATSASKSPSWAAVRNASTTRRCVRRSASGAGAWPWTVRRARLASWRVATTSDPRWARSPRRSSQTHRGARTPVVPPAPASRGPRAAPDRPSRRRSVLFKLLSELLRCGHRSHSSGAVRHCTDGRTATDVTGPTHKEKRNEDQTDQRLRGRPGQSSALLYGGPGLCQEGRLQQRPLSLADRGLTRGAGWYSSCS